MRHQPLPTVPVCQIRLGVNGGKELKEVLEEHDIKDDAVLQEYLRIPLVAWPPDQVLRLHVRVQAGESITAIIRKSNDISDEHLRLYTELVNEMPADDDPEPVRPKRGRLAGTKNGQKKGSSMPLRTTRHGCRDVGVGPSPMRLAVAAIVSGRKRDL